MCPRMVMVIQARFMEAVVQTAVGRADMTLHLGTADPETAAHTGRALSMSQQLEDLALLLRQSEVGARPGRSLLVQVDLPSADALATSECAFEFLR